MAAARKRISDMTPDEAERERERWRAAAARKRGGTPAPAPAKSRVPKVTGLPADPVVPPAPKSRKAPARPAPPAPAALDSPAVLLVGLLFVLAVDFAMWRAAYDTMRGVWDWQSSLARSLGLLSADVVFGLAADILAREGKRWLAAGCVAVVLVCGVADVWLSYVQTQISATSELKRIAAQPPPRECTVVQPQTAAVSATDRATKTQEILESNAAARRDAEAHAKSVCDLWKAQVAERKVLAQARPDGWDYICMMAAFVGALTIAWTLPLFARLMAKRVTQ